MGRRNTNGNVVETVPDESNGDASSGESKGPLTSAQRLAASAAARRAAAARLKDTLRPGWVA